MNFRKWLFGMDLGLVSVLSEDDYLRSLFKWPLILFGNKMQMNIFIAVLCLISMNQIAFIIYVIFWKPELHDVVAMLPTEIFITNIHLLMIFMFKIKALYPEWLKHINIVLEYSNLCSEVLRSRIKYESGLMKLLTHFSIFVAIGNYVLYTWRGGDSKHFFPLLIMEKLATKGLFTKMLFSLIFSYICFSTAIYLNMCTYACAHIYFQLLILEENLEKLNCKYTQNENYQLHNNQYQKMIRRKLKGCWKHYLVIRRLKFVTSEIAYWPIYSGYMFCILGLGSICIYFLLGGHLSENPGMVFTAFLAMAFIVLASENGQFVKSESQNMHDTLLRTQWYQWNRENRKFLLMFLIATQKPLQITSFGIVLNRVLYVKVFKGLYSVTTCINSLRN